MALTPHPAVSDRLVLWLYFRHQQQFLRDSGTALTMPPGTLLPNAFGLKTLRPIERTEPGAACKESIHVVIFQGTFGLLFSGRKRRSPTLSARGVMESHRLVGWF